MSAEDKMGLRCVAADAYWTKQRVTAATALAHDYLYALHEARTATWNDHMAVAATVVVDMAVSAMKGTADRKQ